MTVQFMPAYVCCLLYWMKYIWFTYVAIDIQWKEFSFTFFFVHFAKCMDDSAHDCGLEIGLPKLCLGDMNKWLGMERSRFQLHKKGWVHVTIDFAKTTYRYTHFHPHTPEVCVCGSSYTMWACAQVWKSSIQPLKPLSYNCKWNGSQMIGTIYFLYQARVKPH